MPVKQDIEGTGRSDDRWRVLRDVGASECMASLLTLYRVRQKVYSFEYTKQFILLLLQYVPYEQL